MPDKRVFETGATRDTEDGKLDYEGFNSPLVDKAYAEYLHRHRRLRDGTLRESDNWTKLFGENHYNVCIKSLLRHVTDVRLFHRGYPTETTAMREVSRFEDPAKPFTPEEREALALREAICGAIFNLKAYLYKLEVERVKRSQPHE